MHETIESIRKQFLLELETAQQVSDLEEIKVKYLGKKGPIQQLMVALRDVSQDQRPELGKKINTLKEELTLSVDGKLAELARTEQNIRLSQENIDITIPGRRRHSGRKHPITQEMDFLLNIFKGMGFTVVQGPNIDTDYYNFEALNFPPHHPARDMQDTFYLSKDHLLRTHTSNVQMRVMEGSKPPIRIVSPGRAYRNEAISGRSHVFFHQIEGFAVDEGITFGDLLSTLQEFLDKLFGMPVKTRFRPSFFPFVEPGLECDVHCQACNGSGCPLCKHTGWLEVLGAGMIHPEVLKNGDIDPERYSGFAWGLGVERLVMLKYGITDIRAFTENDYRFLNQFC